MKAVVCAYHEMGCVGLEALIAAGYEVTDVVTHADSPREELWFGSVAEIARAHGVPVHVVEDPNCPELFDVLAPSAPDLLFSFYFRKMIKAPILALPRLGCLNLHGSLLPRYRGRAPVNWVLVHGESETGVTLHYMDEKPDHGEIVGQRRVAVERADTALTLYRKLAVAARGLLDEVLPLLAAGRAPRIPQDHKQSSYFGGRRPEDGRIDWSGPAERAYNLVRAVASPWPGAFTGFRGKKLIVWWGDTVPGPGSLAPGTLALHRGSIAIQTGQGMFVPLRVQWEGEGETDWVEFVRTRDARAGEILK